MIGDWWLVVTYQLGHTMTGNAISRQMLKSRRASGLPTEAAIQQNYACRIHYGFVMKGDAIPGNSTIFAVLFTRPRSRSCGYDPRGEFLRSRCSGPNDPDHGRIAGRRDCHAGPYPV